MKPELKARLDAARAKKAQHEATLAEMSAKAAQGGNSEAVTVTAEAFAAMQKTIREVEAAQRARPVA